MMTASGVSLAILPSTLLPLLRYTTSAAKTEASAKASSTLLAFLIA
jgi:hypothetical protein